MYKKNFSYKRNKFGTRPIGMCLPETIKHLIKKRGFSSGEIIKYWTEIVGKKLAKHSVPIKIKNGFKNREGGILEIKVDGPMALDFQLMEEQIVEKINSFYGFRAIHKIRILQDLVSSNSVTKKHKKPSLSRKTEKHIQEKLANIENNTIKNALKSLASHIKNNNR